MTGDERQRKIESYGQAHGELVAALQKYPRAMWEFKPAPEDWSIHEIAVHIADSEANSFVRCRRFIAEPGSTVMAYDEQQWARALGYQNQSVEDAVELFKWLRLTSYKLIRSLPEAAWPSTIYHSETGTMAMDDWLDVYERHVREHAAQMQRVYDAWRKERPG